MSSARRSEQERPIVGRVREQATLEAMLRSDRPELLAIYGRRRVGKTFLIDAFFRPRVDRFFSVIGTHGRPMTEQLRHFREELERTFDLEPRKPFASWDEAFGALAEVLERAFKKRPRPRIAVFLDELPWLQTRRSGLLESLEYHWNRAFSRMPGLSMILCGSAASWMIDKVVHGKAGLYNRITQKIRLEPFTLGESADFLRARGLSMNHAQVLELYLALGGVPHYLAQAERGLSATQNIGKICFDASGLLSDEFTHLFRALFASSEHHEQIVRALAKRRGGLGRDALIQATGLSSGGGLLRSLRELEAAGFISSLTPYQAKRKNTVYRLIDEYSWFYLKWIEPAPKRLLAGDGITYWAKKSQTPSYRSWAGFSFEGVCLRHADRIRSALGLDSVAVETATWHFAAKAGEDAPGAQVDLLLDRADGVINLCEMKYASTAFEVTKAYAIAVII